MKHQVPSSMLRRRKFIKQGALFVPALFLPRLMDATPTVRRPGIAGTYNHSMPASGGGGGGPAAFIVSGHGTSRNNFTGVVGCKFTASANMTVTALGRLVLSGNTHTHVVFLCTAGGTIITSQTIPTSGITADTYNFVSITPVSLSSGTSYYLVSHEDSGLDSWYDQAAVTTSTGTINNSAHAGSDPPVIFTNDAAGECFVNPNFQYMIP